MDGRSQVGIVACCAVDDYLDGVVKKHENTLEKKERDRIRHIDALDAQTGPDPFSTYRDDAAVDALVGEVKSCVDPCMISRLKTALRTAPGLSMPPPRSKRSPPRSPRFRAHISPTAIIAPLLRSRWV